MKKILLLLIILTIVGFDSVQKEQAYDIGEWFRFKISYGFVNAGYATLEVNEATHNNKKVYHAMGKGYTTGMTKLFFKVEDDYQSFIDKETGKPHHFIRKIYEGGYTKDQEGFFNHNTNTIRSIDHKKQTENTFSVPENTQDILSSFYYLRNYPNIEKLTPGQFVAIDMFFDDEITKFKLKFVGREDIKTKFGIVPSMVFKPYVQHGRVFKAQESLTVWITDDKNRLPVRIKADLAVGSLKAELDQFKGLKHSFNIKVK